MDTKQTPGMTGLDALTSRLERLERRCARQRVGLTALCLVIAAIVLGGSVTGTDSRLKVRTIESERISAHYLQVREIELLTSGNVRRGVIRTRSDGRQGLEVRDLGGRVLLRVPE